MQEYFKFDITCYNDHNLIVNIMSKDLKNSKSELRTGPKDVFLNLLMMVMLYIGVISLIWLSFAYINYKFPDPLSYYRTGILDSIRFHSSMLVVSFPILLILASLIQKDLKKEPKKHELRFSKWLVYLTLLIAALAIIIDLIYLVNRFYDGELTTPFLLKVLAVLAVAGAVFGYYLWDVQNKNHKSKVPKTVAWLSSSAILAMLILGVFMAGSPAEQRKVRMDNARVEHLQMIQSEVVNYWQLKRALPSKLEEVADDIRGLKMPLDPETETAYEYTVIGPLRFKLCATFTMKSVEGEQGISRYDYYPQSGDSWSHEAGNVCFERTIDPDLYPTAPVK